MTSADFDKAVKPFRKNDSIVIVFKGKDDDFFFPAIGKKSNVECDGEQVILSGKWKTIAKPLSDVKAIRSVEQSTIY